MIKAVFAEKTERETVGAVLGEGSEFYQPALRSPSLSVSIALFHVQSRKTLRNSTIEFERMMKS